jgi:hypothetical protein
MARSGTLMVVGSLAKCVLKSPPPVTVAWFVMLAGSVLSTETVIVIAGKLAVAARASERVQFTNDVGKGEQDQPVPVMTVAVIPKGRKSLTWTVPTVATVPVLLTVIV